MVTFLIPSPLILFLNIISIVSSIDSSSLFFFNEKNGNGDDIYYSHHYHLEYTAAAAMLKYRITLLFHTYYIDLRLKYSENDFHYAFRCNSCISLSANIAVSNMNTAAYAKKHYTVNSESGSSSGNSHDQKSSISDGGRITETPPPTPALTPKPPVLCPYSMTPLGK